VLKPNDEYGGTGVTLGWEASESDWDAALSGALADPPGTWVVQERIPIRREVFPHFDSEGHVVMRDMLVDLAPYVFRGTFAGFLTRLSATGLANVTSGGGQVPAFVVSQKAEVGSSARRMERAGEPRHRRHNAGRTEVGLSSPKGERAGCEGINPSRGGSEVGSWPSAATGLRFG